MVTMSVLHASVSGSVETKKVRMMLPEVASGDSKLIPSSVFLDDLVASKRLSFFDVVLRILVVLTVIVVVGVVFILIVERIKRWGVVGVRDA